jgi:hypothetical protein
MAFWIWLGVLGLGVVGFLIGLTGLALPRCARFAALQKAAALLITALIIVQVVDLTTAAQQAVRGPGQFLALAGILAAGLAILQIVRPWAILRAAPLSSARAFGLALALVFVSGGVTSWLGYRALAQMEGTVAEFDNQLATAGTDLEVVPTVTAQTDKGTPIRVFTNRIGGNPDHSAEDAFLRGAALENRVIQTAPPDKTYNCHGWTFAAGQYHLVGREVELILADNGYTPVEQPAVGDVIVYRDETGAITHTGVVKATGADGVVLIESKWGVMGRYIHTPENQCYGPNFTYYRTPRPGHLLAGVLGSETVTAGSWPDPDDLDGLLTELLAE